MTIDISLPEGEQPSVTVFCGSRFHPVFGTDMSTFCLR